MIELRSLFSREKSWDWGLILSYELHPISFFETEILPHLKISKNFTVVIDDSSYQDLVSSNDFTPNHLGIFYNLEKVRIRRGGIFHSKMYLFLNDDELLLILGSANLTITGIKHNLENLAILRFEKANLSHDEFFILGQLKAILRDSFINDNELFEPISKTLRQTVGEIISSPFMEEIDEADRIRSEVNNTRNSFLFSSLNKGLLSQILDVVGEGVEKVQILSPFFDQSMHCFDFIQKISKETEIYIPRKNNSFPKDLISGNIQTEKNTDYFIAEKIDEKTDRFIHAKYYRFNKNDSHWDFITSGNFTNSGLVNDSYPRNFEMGFLYSTKNDDFLSDSQIHIEKIDDFKLISPKILDETQDKAKDSLFIVFESAVYDQGKIYISFNKKFLESNLINDFSVELLLNNENSEILNIVCVNSSCYVEPSLEIEGNLLIKIRLISISGNEFSGLPLIVNRTRHNPNYLPVLGASSFNKCVKIGGIEGLEEAFRLAKNSGRKDWVLHLLAHWNLDKIVAGMRMEKYGNSEDMDESEPNEIPSIRKPHKNKNNERIRKNLDCVIGNINMHMKLEKYLDEMDNLSSDIDDRVENYINHCFPLFFHLAEYFRKILEREEAKKKDNPNIKYPKYTWGHNFNQYDYFLIIIFERIRNTLMTSNKCLKKIDKYFRYLSYAFLCCKLHTKKTIEEFHNEHERFIGFEKDLIIRLNALSKRVSQKIKLEINDLYQDYEIITDIQFLE